jgi:LysM repeat protein
MQRDQKVGLALGVLLIGAVAAFFFRNEPDPTSRIPALESAETVNREIAEKQLTPYISVADPKESKQEERVRVATARTESDPRTGERKLPRWEELQAEQDDPFTEDSSPPSVPVPAPDPIQPETVAVVAPPETATPVVEQPLAKVAVDEAYKAESTPAFSGIVHEVLRGETLSSIAAKYLGSQAKFYAIYEANKDLLRDANDLQVGMKLRIPDAKTVSAIAPPARAVKSKTLPVEQPAKTPDADFGKNPASAVVIAPTSAVKVIGADPEIAEPIVEEKPLVDEKPLERPQIKFTPAKRRPRKAVESE